MTLQQGVSPHVDRNILDRSHESGLLQFMFMQESVPKIGAIEKHRASFNSFVWLKLDSYVPGLTNLLYWPLLEEE